ncbi:MG319/MPN454 family protein [[Mycoplasma] imitans]|uniref:MG319/MPN454 family protein n=1 Tax=[Mycoplasma] imitans TaxID=29560 RepID=UPI00047FD4A8|nr:hypothetical protein [[Mycoplasma] imitans]
MSNIKLTRAQKVGMGFGFFFLFLVLLIGFIYLFLAFLWYDKQYNPVKLYNNFFSKQALEWFNRDNSYEWGSSTYHEFARMLPDPSSVFGKIKNFIPVLYNTDSFLGTHNSPLKAGFFGYFIPLGISFVSSLLVSLIFYAIFKAIIISSIRRKQKAQKLKLKKEAQAKSASQQQEAIYPNTL